MQAELENWAIDWINEHCDLALSNPNPVRYLRDKFAELLEGKVLCEKEPVAYSDGRNVRRAVTVANYSSLQDSYTQPLYAPASPLGNADINKTPAVPNGEYEPEYRSGIRDCNEALPREFWKLSKVHDGRAVILLTEQQYNQLRAFMMAVRSFC